METPVLGLWRFQARDMDGAGVRAKQCNGMQYAYDAGDIQAHE